MVYASESVALATLEILAKTRMFEGLRDRVAVPADIPDQDVVEASKLPTDWKQFPHAPSTRAYGNAWYDGQTSLALVVPSVVVPGHNVLVNPTHPRASQIVVGEPVLAVFDQRLTGEP
jgi:RES domain-containing protein